MDDPLRAIICCTAPTHTIERVAEAAKKDRETMPENTDQSGDLIELTADIVSAFVSNNAVPVSNLADLISSIHASLSSIGKAAPPQVKPQAPAVNPKRSVTSDFIVCLDDGKKFKSLKRHLAQLGMTPDQYRTKWNLPGDYPMVAPNYAAQRSALAKSIGLGRKAAPMKKVAAKRKAK